MKYLLCFTLFLGTTCSMAQTKKIAHRSHSGNNTTFSLDVLDNFGETPEMMKEWERIQKEEQKKKAKEKKNEEKKNTSANGSGGSKSEKGSSTGADSSKIKVDVEKAETANQKEEKKKAKAEKKQMKKEQKAQKKSKKSEQLVGVKGQTSKDNNQPSEKPIHKNLGFNDSQQIRTSNSHASINWMLYLLLLMPSVIAIKSIHQKL